ncbi:MAG: nuclear transport factor 2 family protein [Pseudomonadota bacterium]
MTAKANHELVERLLAAFSHGGLEALAGFYSPDYVNRTPFPGAPTTLDGHAAFEEWARPHLEFVAMEPVEIVAGDNNATVLSRTRFRSRKTGEEFEAFGFAVLRIEDGLIVENWGGYDPVSVLRMQKAGVELPSAA